MFVLTHPTESQSRFSPTRDLPAALVVYLVALPLCLGIALASGAPPSAGLVSGIIGGVLVGFLSGSHSSVSGPAAGLTAVVSVQIATLGSFESFLAAVVIAGFIQVVLGVLRAGILSAFIPTSVISGLLAAIGVILILKQLPHVVGHDSDPEGEMSFFQTDSQNTFSELLAVLDDFQPGALVVGVFSLALLVAWDKLKPLKKSPVPAPMAVVALGVALGALFDALIPALRISGTHLVQVPESSGLEGLGKYLIFPEPMAFGLMATWSAGLVIALVASLETLLNVEAVDKIDPLKRSTNPQRELLAQGMGNMVCGLAGGLPVTSVIVRSSVNINAGGRSRWVAVVHGLLLAVTIVAFTGWVNRIPLSCLAAILLVTGFKLASPAEIFRMWGQGAYQFVPFAATMVAIVLTDLLVGVVIGLLVSVGFILYSNYRRPIRQILERHASGDLLRIELASQVSFLNRANLKAALRDMPDGSSILVDATNTVFIDPDILEMFRQFRDEVAPARGIRFSAVGFKDQYSIHNQTQFVDYVTRDLQERMTPAQVLEILREGNNRFRTGQRLTRDLGKQMEATAAGQHPLAVVLTCIDSRTPSELIFDQGLGDIFSIRIAGNIVGRKVMGSLEYSCAVAGAKLVLVMGHTRCGAVTAAVGHASGVDTGGPAATCDHLGFVAGEIARAMKPSDAEAFREGDASERERVIDNVARENVRAVVGRLTEQSLTLRRLAAEGRILIVGAIYDVSSGNISFLEDAVSGVEKAEVAKA